MTMNSMRLVVSKLIYQISTTKNSYIYVASHFIMRLTSPLACAVVALRNKVRACLEREKKFMFTRFSNEIKQIFIKKFA